MKKFISIIVALTLIVASLGTVAFAAYTSVDTSKSLSFNGYSSITVPANEVDNAIEIKLILSELPSDFSYGVDLMTMAIKTEGVKIQSGVTLATAASLGLETLTNSPLDTETNTLSFIYSTTSEDTMTDTQLNNIDNVIATFNVKRVDNATTATISFENNTALEDTVSEVVVKGSTIGQNLTINFDTTPTPTYPSYAGNEALTGEETFADDSIFNGTPITSDSKSFTVFGKATQALSSGEYGIKVKATDDKTYTFKGLSPVAENGLWAIKVVSPDGTFKFADGETLTTKSIQTFEKGTFTDVSMN